MPSATSIYSQNCIVWLLGSSGRRNLHIEDLFCLPGPFCEPKRIKKMRRKQPTAIIEHLALLSVKHSIYLAELFEALVSARQHGKTMCQTLTIEYRGSIKQEAIFLITKESAVIGQFRAAEEFLQRRNICFDNWMETDKIRRQLDKQKMGANLFILIQDLRHGMKKINIKAEVLEKTAPSKVFTQYGNSATITNARIADETGKVKLCLWNEQADFINTGDLIQIQNATVSTYKGERQLSLGKSGTVSILNRSK